MKNFHTTAQIIKNNGKPEWAVIPYSDYVELLELADLSLELDSFREKLKRKEEDLIPANVVKLLLEGKNSIKVWREHRGLSMADLAKKSGISVPYLSQLEHGSRSPSTNVLKKISFALNVGADDLLNDG
jgi:DNA-binding XRE family transcriptional regulator